MYTGEVWLGSKAMHGRTMGEARSGWMTGCDVDGHREAWYHSGSAGGQRAWDEMDNESWAIEHATGCRHMDTHG